LGTMRHLWHGSVSPLGAGEPPLGLQVEARNFPSTNEKKYVPINTICEKLLPKTRK